MKNYLEKEYIVQIADIDFKSEARLSGIMNFLQDSAIDHAEEIGIGYENSKEFGVFWVLTKFEIEIRRIPELGEKIRVLTWPLKPEGGFEAMREFELFDGAGNALVCASSKWCFIDTVKRRLTKMKEDVYALKDFIDRRAAAEPERVPTAEGALCTEFFARSSSIDRNGHVNNARYGDMVMDCFSVEEIKGAPFKRFAINFVNELKPGERAQIYRQDLAGGDSLVTGKKDEEIIFRALIAR